MARFALPPALLAATLLAGCMTTSSKNSGRIQTTDDVEHKSVPGAVSAPLHDLNVLRTKVPWVLLDATADPYARPPPDYNCGQLIALMEPLDNALGADLDEPPKDEDDLLHKGSEMALGAVADAASGVIPFRGWVRKLTGAEKHDDMVQDAITSGAVRRGYLKGLGEAMGCSPPATPSHVLASRATVEQRLKSHYPTRRHDAPGTPGGMPAGDPPR